MTSLVAFAIGSRTIIMLWLRIVNERFAGSCLIVAIAEPLVQSAPGGANLASGFAGRR